MWLFRRQCFTNEIVIQLDLKAWSETYPNDSKKSFPAFYPDTQRTPCDEDQRRQRSS